MAIKNDFLPFAAAGNANVITQAQYAALASVTSGFLSGEVLSVHLNKVLRQHSIMSAVLAQFIVDATGQTAIDDGTTATLIANLQRAIATYNVSLDSGVVNALAVTLNPPLAAYVPGMLLSVENIIATNTGTATVSANGLAAIPIVSAFGALQGGELFAGTGAILRINAAGTGAELIQTTGGTLPVKAATAAGQAVNLGQGDGRYAALAGNAQQSFSAASASVASQVATYAQVSGIGQSRANVTASRAVGVTYTNSTQKAKQVVVIINSFAANATFSFTVGVVNMGGNTIYSGSSAYTFTVQAGENYSLSSMVNAVIGTWIELG